MRRPKRSGSKSAKCARPTSLPGGLTDPLRRMITHTTRNHRRYRISQARVVDRSSGVSSFHTETGEESLDTDEARMRALTVLLEGGGRCAWPRRDLAEDSAPRRQSRRRTCELSSDNSIKTR